MADAENRGTEPRREPHRIFFQLTRNAIAYAREIYQRTKKEAWTKPIEFVGVLVLIVYTIFAGYQSCQTRTANHIALLGLAASEGAVFKIEVVDSFTSLTEAPAIGANFTNIGKASATNVTGSLRIRWYDSKGEILENKTVTCTNRFIAATTNLFGCSHVLGQKAALLMKNANGGPDFPELIKDTATVVASITWNDGFGDVITDSRDYFLLVRPNIYVEKTDPRWGKFGIVEFEDSRQLEAYMEQFAKFPSVIAQLKRSGAAN